MVPGRFVLPGVFGDHGRDAAQAADLDRSGHHLAELVEIDGLDQVIVGPLAHGLDGRLRAGVSRDDDHRQARIDLSDVDEGLQAGHVGQADVEDHGVGRLLADHVDPLLRARGGDDLQLVALQAALERVEDVWLVVDDQQLLHPRTSKPVGFPG